MATWCSGTGSALAERRTSVRGERGGRMETVSLWVSLDRVTLRPVPLDGLHFDPYREAAGDRRVRARFLVPGPPPDGRTGRPWPLRRSDIDLLSHVNNVVAWTAVEEEAVALTGGGPVTWGQLEYRRAIEPGETPLLRSAPLDGAVGAWLLGVDGTPAGCARLGLS